MIVKAILLTVGLCLLAYAQEVKVEVGTSAPIFTTRQTLVSFNFDWWPRTQPAWQNAGLLNIDLTNPTLIYLTKNLAPAHLRIGGTLGDTIVYQVGDYASCTAGINCFNTTRFSQLNDFVKSTGVGLVFGLNEMYNGRKSGQTWNTTNVDAFLQYTAEQGYQVFGFEIGNELNEKLTPEDCANDARALKQLVNKYWATSSIRPKVIAPDDNPDASWWNLYLKLSSGSVDIYTYHFYNGYGGNPKLPEQIPTTKFIDESRNTAQNFLSLVTQYAPKAELWLGEGAAAWDSGQNGTTNSFESGFYYLNALGAQAQHKHTGSQRQALVGGYYELIDKITYTPNPDYYTAYLWKNLMDVKVLSTTYTLDSTEARIFAHCTRKAIGSVTVAYVNVGKNHTTLTLEGLTNVAPRHEYYLSTPTGDLRSRHVALNGKTLYFTGGKLPLITPKVVTDNAPIILPAQSYGFIVFPNALAKACNP